MRRFGRRAMTNQLLVVLAIASFPVLGPSSTAAAQLSSAGGIDEVDVVHATAVVEKIDIEKRKVTPRRAVRWNIWSTEKRHAASRLSPIRRNTATRE
jgi:hypothetical protein